MIEKLSDQRNPKIGSIINRENIAARKVLEKVNFSFKDRFDLIQDLYETSLTEKAGLIKKTSPALN